MTPAIIQLPDAKPLLALSVLVGLLAWETIQPFFSFPKGRRRLRHGFGNVLFGVANGLMTTLGFIGLWWFASDWAARNGFGLLNMQAVPEVVEWTLAILMLDAWTYLWHRMNHRIPFL